ncbi:hypothetical protein D3C77_290550 [compost metagenome]
MPLDDFGAAAGCVIDIGQGMLNVGVILTGNAGHLPEFAQRVAMCASLSQSNQAGTHLPSGTERDTIEQVIMQFICSNLVQRIIRSQQDAIRCLRRVKPIM